VTRTGPVLFVALLVATVVTAAGVLHARTPDLALQVTHFTTSVSPQERGAEGRARISFFVREGDPDARVQIVGPSLRVVRTLYRGPLVADRRVSFAWDGRSDDGDAVNPRHRYRLRVILPGQDRDMVYPRRIAVTGSGSG
jgi:hypothetical protein